MPESLFSFFYIASICLARGNTVDGRNQGKLKQAENRAKNKSPRFIGLLFSEGSNVAALFPII
jgi:hypothetical protein